MSKLLLSVTFLLISTVVYAESYVCSFPSPVEGFPPNMDTFSRLSDGSFEITKHAFNSDTKGFSSGVSEDERYLVIHEVHLDSGQSNTYMINKETGQIRVTVMRIYEAEPYAGFGSCITI